jgi:thiol-disulfide isomerase/thioredoxin
MRFVVRFSLVVVCFLLCVGTMQTLSAQVATGKVYALASVSPQSDAKVGTKVPDFVWNDNGKQVKLSEFAKGKVIFINFWGTWCPPCRKEIPDIIEISKDEKDVVVVGIALERVKDRIKQVQDYVQKTGIPYINVTGEDKVIGSIVAAFGGINAVPTTFIVNKSGVIAEQIVGSQSKAEFLNSIKKARQ